jgi:hypothetical protein
MNMHTECTEPTPALGKITTVLMAACLAALITGCAPQTGGPPPPATAAPPPLASDTPSPASAVAWVQIDSEGNRRLYYLQDGKPVLAAKLIGTQRIESTVNELSYAPPQRPRKPAPPVKDCFPNPYIWFC